MSTSVPETDPVLNAEAAPENAESDKREETAEAQTEPKNEKKKKKKEKKPFKVALRERGFLKPGFLICLSLFVLSVLLYVACRFLPDLAEFWTRYPSQGIRFVLAKLTGWIPFSLMEFLIYSLPIIIIAFFIFSGRSLKKKDTTENFHKWLNPLICTLLVIASLFCTAFGPCYFRRSLSENLSLVDAKVSAEQLDRTARKVSAELETVLSEIRFQSDGASVQPYGYGELVEKINDAYETFANDPDHGFLSTFRSAPKRLFCSPVFTYTHISGVYTFVTGEANINTNYPDFIRPFTIAHEMAHQRGVAKEEEANFVAYLVCLSSDDPYVRYSACTLMLQYLGDALAKADKERYREVYGSVLPAQYSGEMKAYSLFFNAYRDSTASKVTQAVNNTYLNSQGEKAGTASYGLVVDLAVAYYESFPD